MSTRTVPADLSDLTQETYDLYMKEVKAILFQTSFKQILITPEHLSAVDDYEITAIPQASGGILVQLQPKTGSYAELLETVKNLPSVEQQLLKGYMNSFY